MISTCPPRSPLLSRTGRFDIHLSEEKSFMVIGKYFFFKTLLHFWENFYGDYPITLNSKYTFLSCCVLFKTNVINRLFELSF